MSKDDLIADILIGALPQANYIDPQVYNKKT